MVGKRVERGVRRRQHLDAKALIQRPRQKLRRLQFRFDGFVVRIRRRRRESFGQAEQLLKCIVQPQARGGSAEEMIVAGEDAPHLARILNLLVADLQFFKRDSLAVQHAKDVVIRLNEQRHRVGERLVAREPCGLRMAMRAHDGQGPDARIQPSRNRPCAFFRRKQPVFMKQRHSDLPSPVWCYA